MTPTTPAPVAPSDVVIGQIARTVGTFLLQAQYPTDYEDVLKRLMMGERIPISVGGRIAFVHRDTEFDTWYLRRA